MLPLDIISGIVAKFETHCSHIGVKKMTHSQNNLKWIARKFSSCAGLIGFEDFSVTQLSYLAGLWVRLKRTSEDPVRTAVTVAVALFVSVMSGVWLTFGLLNEQRVVTGLAAFQLVGSVGSLVLILQGRVTHGRVTWFFSTLFVMSVAMLAVPSEGRVEQMFFPLIAGIFLHCSFRREKRLILWLIAICILAWAFLQLTGPGFFFAPIVSSQFAAEVVAPLSSTSAMIMGGVNVGLFALLAERYEQVLESEREKSDQANAAKSEFLAAMSHEIRTPMNGVLGMAEILATTELNSAQRRGLSVIRDSGSALLRIIDDILDISSVEAGRLVLSTAPTNLEATLEGAIDTLRAYAANNGVTLRYVVTGPLPRSVEADEGRLRQIIINLLGNAIKFTGKVTEDRAKEVTVISSIDDLGQLQIVFRDTGIGIPSNFLPKLFEPFGRSEAARKAKIGGTGLGLAIVKRLVDLMGGKIVVASEVGIGTEITLSLPLESLVPAEILSPPVPTLVRLIGMTNTQAQVWRTACASFGLVPTEVRLNDVTGHFEPGYTRYIDVCGVSDNVTVKALMNVRHDRETMALRRTCIFENSDTMAWTTWIDDAACLIQANPVAPSEAHRILHELIFDRHEHRTGSSSISVVAPAPTGATDKLRILVAEDDETNQVIIEQQLKILGFEVVVVSDGSEALRKLENERFDLLLTDCQMPVMDGFELTESIRAKEKRSGLAAMPIIAITANALRGEGERCLSKGMTGYLAKPVRSADLKRALAEHAVKPRLLN